MSEFLPLGEWVDQGVKLLIENDAGSLQQPETTTVGNFLYASNAWAQRGPCGRDSCFYQVRAHHLRAVSGEGERAGNPCLWEAYASRG